MTANLRRRKLLLSVIALALAAATGVGIWLAARGGRDPVYVYPFQSIGMTEFWGDAQESYGPVTTDKIQTAFLSDTQTVTDVAVKDGDTVKKGDILFSFDTTLDALSLERKRLEVKKVEVRIAAAEERLEEVKKLKPYVPAPEKEPEEEDLGEQLKEQLFKISENTVYDGSKGETALICWLRDDTAVSDAILQQLYETSLKYREENAAKQEQNKKEESSASSVPEMQTDGKTPEEEPLKEKTYRVEGFYTCNGETVRPDNITVGKNGYLIRDSYTYQGKTYWLDSAIPRNKKAVLKDLKIDPYPQNETEQAAWEEVWKDGLDVQYIRDVSVTGGQLENNRFVPIEKDKLLQLKVDREAVLMFQSEMKQPPENTYLEFSVSPSDGILSVAHRDGYLILSGKPEETTDEPVDYTVTARYSFDDNHGENRVVEETFGFSISVIPEEVVKKGQFYVIFKVTEDNYLKGNTTVWRGSKVTAYQDGSFEMLPFDATGVADHTLPVVEDVDIELPEIIIDAVYTAEEILEMKTGLYATIKEQKENLKLAEQEYAIMQRELGDGNVYAEIDGKVVSLLTEAEARQNDQPLMKVSGGGGFYIEGSVSELEKTALKIGQEVTVNDWNTGNVYTGEVVSIGEFPSEGDHWNGMGNPTAAYYPFKAFVGEDADLQAGSYVSMSYSTSTAERGIYLEKAFVRTEDGSSFVYVRGADGKLEKRTARVGKVLWGSYYEILSDLSAEDWLAFPYGKQIKQGAPTVESELSTLYGY